MPSNPTRQFRISQFAEADIETILEWTDKHFGEDARLRYEALLEQAMIDVSANPRRARSLALLKLQLSRSHTICGTAAIV